MKHNKIQWAFFYVSVLPFLSCCRSIHRPIDRLMPEIKVKWVGDNREHTLRKYHLEEYALYQLFDKQHFEKNLLSAKPISIRNTATPIDSTFLTTLINNLMEEINNGKTFFSDFIILQSKDWNFKKKKGLLIVKFNNYPFVVKLFVETPESFVSPFDKGLEPIFFFFMGGGVNRHLAGFTRIKNRDIIKQRLMQSKWAETTDIPEKWYWVPDKTRWIQVKGKYISGNPHEKTIQFPGTYCVIAQAIDAERTLSLLNSEDKKLALEICNYLDIWIDPHMKNFMIEKDTHKFVIVDTEHFPTTVGLREKINFDSYSNWYLYLAGKCWNNAFMQTKRRRRNPLKPIPEMCLA